ncbi:hypothetical protein CVT25_015112 [Psilocybe cyanescens]|uniref:Uncharacterized protein n=1 Tax=Psilocybe cyanescens TaxID=93625 RepID=A0A409XIK2_PSICY|nr:hypothetical protein CVT25_015112 [Psilocybe cyanescens]
MAIVAVVHVVVAIMRAAVHVVRVMVHAVHVVVVVRGGGGWLAAAVCGFATYMVLRPCLRHLPLFHLVPPCSLLTSLYTDPSSSLSLSYRVHVSGVVAIVNGHVVVMHGLGWWWHNACRVGLAGAWLRPTTAR